MTVSEIMQSYCVRVNGGSGVIVNAMTLEYSYVLTAAHVLEGITDHEVIDYQGNLIEVIDILRHSESFDPETLLNDYAILKVCFQAHVAQKIFSALDLPHRADLTLVGWPETERTSLDPIKFYDGHMTNVINSLIVFTIDGIPGKTTIDGMSGGGIYFLRDGLAFLTGVEFKMDSIEQDQQYGRVQCHSLLKFEEIIKIHECAPIIPAHLECFSRMRERIFTFNVIDPDNIRHLKIALESFTESLIASGMPPPYKILEQYGSQLLVDPLKSDELNSLELWDAYLEFLVICALMDNIGTTDDVYIEGLERKRRLIYTSSSDNWIRRLEEFLKTARRLLDQNGTLIIASPDAAASPLPPNFRLQKVINNIALVPNQGPFAPIDEVESLIYSSFRLTHLQGLRKTCVVDIEDEYQVAASGREQLQLLRDKLNEIIK